MLETSPIGRAPFAGSRPYGRNAHVFMSSPVFVPFACPSERRMAEETEKERIDREVIELLNELRVTLPGVQVLFGFLPIQQRFTDLNQPERTIYIVAVVATVAALICLIAPASYHRLRFRATDKQRMLFISNRLAIAGIVFLAIAIV